MTLEDLIEEERELREDVQEMAIETGLDHLAEALENDEDGSEGWVRAAGEDLRGITIDPEDALSYASCLVSLGCLIDRSDRIQKVLEGAAMGHTTQQAEG